MSAAAEEYRAAHRAAILVDRSDLGRLALRGRDALDLLHRLTTNGIKDLRPGQGAATLFTTPKGRILDLVLLHRLEDEILALTGPGRSQPVASWIERFTIREEVRVEDLSAARGTLGLFGAQAARAVSGLFGEEAARRPLHDPLRVEVPGAQGARAVLCRTYPLVGEGYHLTAEVPDLPALRQSLLEEPRGVRAAGADCLEVLRIEAGLPAHGRELTEDYNPWEARLQDAISLTKGCYVGQEVIARLNTYKKVSKLLVRLQLAGGRAPAPGSLLESQGEAIGTLTSAAEVPGEDRVVALGYVRDEDAQAGREIEVASGAGRLRATIAGPAR